MKRRKRPLPSPEIQQLKKELNRTNYNLEYNRVLRSTIYSLIIVAAVAVLIAVLCLPVLQIANNNCSQFFFFPQPELPSKNG